MIRTLGPSVLLFLLPFALYFLWLAVQRRSSAEAGRAKNSHIAWVAAVGLVLAVAAFVIFADFRGATPDQVYVPPRYENGKLIPGHFEPAPVAP